MNAVKLQNHSDKSKTNNFEVAAKLHPRVISGENGTVAGVYALSESLKRGDAYLEAQKRLNEVCLPEPKIKLSNTLIIKEISHV